MRASAVSYTHLDVYKRQGQAIYVEKINAEAGSEVTFNEVVLVGGDKTVVGTPVVEGATVVGTCLLYTSY